MIFWDTSAVVPLVVDEPLSPLSAEVRSGDPGMVTWWGTRSECLSAIARLERDNDLDTATADRLRADLDLLAGAWHEVAPVERVRDQAARILLRHPLKAANALQLAAAMVWARERPRGHRFFTLHSRLGAAARGEGFEVVQV